MRIWYAPKEFIRDRLSVASESGALGVVMLACSLIFVSEWPALLQQTQLDDSIPLDARLGAALFACIFILPLGAYFLAAIAHLVIQIIKRWALKKEIGGNWLAARLALFYTMLVVSPFMVIDGLLSVFFASNALMIGYDVLLLGGFLYLWVMMLVGAEGV